MTSAQLTPAILIPLVVWRIYVRVRRNIGRQRLVAKGLKTRIIIFAVITVLFGAGAALYLPSLAAFGGALVGSVVLAWWGVKLTRFERTSEGDFYTPNTVIGVGLSLILVARVVYRFTVLYPMALHGGAPTAPSTFHSPLTLAIVGLTFGYYVAYYVGVLRRARHLDAVSTPVSVP